MFQSIIRWMCWCILLSNSVTGLEPCSNTCYVSDPGKLLRLPKLQFLTCEMNRRNILYFMGGIVKYRVQHMHGRSPVSVNFSFQIKSRGVNFG